MMILSTRIPSSRWFVTHMTHQSTRSQVTCSIEEDERWERCVMSFEPCVVTFHHVKMGGPPTKVDEYISYGPKLLMLREGVNQYSKPSIYKLYIIPWSRDFSVVTRAFRIVWISHTRLQWVRLNLGMFGCFQLHSATLSAWLRQVTSIFGHHGQKEYTTHHEQCRSTSFTYFSNSLWFFGLNGTDRALEGHNIPQTSHRRNSKCEFHQESSMFHAGLSNVDARARVLSMQQAVACGVCGGGWWCLSWISHQILCINGNEKPMFRSLAKVWSVT